MRLLLKSCGAWLQTTALQRALGKFNIAEVARTGKICLKRGEALLDIGGWGDGQAKQMRDQRQHGQARAAAAEADRDNGSNHGNGAEAAAAGVERGVDEGQDVYVSGGNDKAGQRCADICVNVALQKNCCVKLTPQF